MTERTLKISLDKCNTLSPCKKLFTIFKQLSVAAVAKVELGYFESDGTKQKFKLPKICQQLRIFNKIFYFYIVHITVNLDTTKLKRLN